MSQFDKVKIVKRIINELEENQVVNLGIGIPTIIPNYLKGKKIFFQSENGLLGIGPAPPENEINMDLTSAGREPITMEIGSSLFDSSASFAMIRGGHIDVAVLGALQVDQTGEIANWAVPGKAVLGVGGAMDLIVGAKKVIIAMTHTSKDNQPKLVEKLTFPSSGSRKIDMVVTEHAVFKFNNNKMILIEIISDITLEELMKITEANFIVEEKLLSK